MSNHYQTLGVHHDASHELVLAAYRALVKAFHPDTFKADRNFAEARLKEINNAFEIVGTPDLRRLYDQTLKKEQGKKSSKSNRTNHDCDHQESWSRTCDFFPSLRELDADLSLISPELSRKFRSEILSKRNFEDASNVSQRLISDFASDKFGSSQDLRAAGLIAMRLGYRSFALEINKACLLVGDQNADAILHRLVIDHSDEATRIYSSCGLDRFLPAVLKENDGSSAGGFKEMYGLYKIRNKVGFRILPNQSVTVFFENGFHLEEYKSFSSLRLLLQHYGEDESEVRLVKEDDL